MKIVKVRIDNYRNLDKVEMYFNPDMNFLIGENDLGKSNLLDMFDVVFNRRRFSEEDFFNNSNLIKIEFSLLLSEAEKGNFEDYFDPIDNNLINIIAKQEAPDEDLKYFHKESEEEIHYSKLRCVNFLKYDSLRTPQEELTFYRRRGVGKFLSYLVNRVVTEDDKQDDFIKKESINPILLYINEIFKKMRLIKDFMISASIEKEITDLVFRILTIKDSQGIEIQKTGHGVQFSLLIMLHILERLMQIIEDKRRQECLFTANGEKTISLILGMDEPEIHLHPYMQRSLMNFVSSFLQNKEALFSSLVKELFDIDKFDGQTIIVSHSPNILLNNYKYIARFYKEESKIKVTSGSQLQLTPEIEKHLLKNFSYIKEAFFSRCVIIVEGDTEYGALPMWAEKIIGNLDDLGITVIHGGGANSIPPIANLLNKLKLSNVRIVDRDVYESSRIKYDSIPNLFVTDKRDFEEELVENLFTAGKDKILFELVDEHDTIGLKKRIQKSKLKDIAEKYGITITWDDNDYAFNEILEVNDKENLKKAMFLSWLDINKSIILGRIIGEKVELDYIPKKYKETIEQAKVMS
jgi:putative ATP-dependent endonuclease of OLD family